MAAWGPVPEGAPKTRPLTCIKQGGFWKLGGGGGGRLYFTSSILHALCTVCIGYCSTFVT